MSPSPRGETTSGCAVSEPFGCPRDALRRGAATPISLAPDPRGRPREAIALLNDAGEVRVYLNLCMHLPIPLDSGSREFFDLDGAHLMCGTHGALYRLDDGYCFEGPCRGASLIALPFRITMDGRVEILG